VADFFQELISAAVYKRSQGRITRQVSFAALAITFALGCYRLHVTLKGSMASDAHGGLIFWLPGIILFLGWWLSYRMVNFPRFADFLIAVEAELNKVSWPTRLEMVRASVVVIIMIFSLSAVIFLFDMMWKWMFFKII
jgi:preprotein translocase subunit SecE